jgi:hypothetical protein
LLVHETTHLPATQLSPESHCDWSKHWFACVVHTPPPDGPAMQMLPPVQSESLSQALGFGDTQVPLAEHV